MPVAQGSFACCAFFKPESNGSLRPYRNLDGLSFGSPRIEVTAASRHRLFLNGVKNVYCVGAK